MTKIDVIKMTDTNQTRNDLKTIIETILGNAKKGAENFMNSFVPGSQITKIPVSQYFEEPKGFETPRVIRIDTFAQGSDEYASRVRLCEFTVDKRSMRRIEKNEIDFRLKQLKGMYSEGLSSEEALKLFNKINGPSFDSRYVHEAVKQYMLQRNMHPSISHLYPEIITLTDIKSDTEWKRIIGLEDSGIEEYLKKIGIEGTQDSAKELAALARYFGMNRKSTVVPENIEGIIGKYQLNAHPKQSELFEAAAKYSNIVASFCGYDDSESECYASVRVNPRKRHNDLSEVSRHTRIKASKIARFAKEIENIPDVNEHKIQVYGRMAHELDRETAMSIYRKKDINNATYCDLQREFNLSSKYAAKQAYKMGKKYVKEDMSECHREFQLKFA